jgi:hypothetical protein
MLQAGEPLRTAQMGYLRGFRGSIFTRSGHSLPDSGQ